MLLGWRLSLLGWLVGQRLALLERLALCSPPILLGQRLALIGGGQLPVALGRRGWFIVSPCFWGGRLWGYFLRFAGRGAARFGGLLAGRLTAGGLPAPILSARRAMESNARLSFWAQKAPPLDL